MYYVKNKVCITERSMWRIHRSLERDTVVMHHFIHWLGIWDGFRVVLRKRSDIIEKSLKAFY